MSAPNVNGLKPEDPREVLESWLFEHRGDELTPGQKAALSAITGRLEAPESAPARQVRLTPLSEVKPEPVRWAWDQRLPVGEVCLTPGKGGLGKSTFHAWLCAALTRGELPGVHYGTPKPVVIASTEDSYRRTIVPRLIVAGADLSMVYRVEIAEHGGEALLSLPTDLAGLEAAIVRLGVALVSIDPLMSVIEGRLDTHKDRDVRQMLEPLSKMADRTGVVILGNAHFNKSAGSDPMSLIMGSAAFGNVVRSVLGFIRDPEADDGSCIVSQLKNNLGRLDLPNLRYRIEEAHLDTEHGAASVGRLVMLGEADRSLEEILRDRGTEEERTERDEAAEWLAAFLQSRGGSESAGVIQQEGERLGFNKRTLQRARTRAGVKHHKQGMLGGWVWELSTSPPKTTEDPHFKNAVVFDPFVSSSKTTVVFEGNEGDKATSNGSGGSFAEGAQNGDPPPAEEVTDAEIEALLSGFSEPGHEVDYGTRGRDKVSTREVSKSGGWPPLPPTFSKQRGRIKNGSTTRA